ncbi:MAG TPA: hypothetical protein VFR86_14025 [Burkholderiaceae bacterium]|nr:hypothetical protein [Burkholderiaceae bacterium]
MARHPSSRPARDDVLVEVAAAAARLIAEHGCDYATARRRAVAEVFGHGDARSAAPDNALIESELRRYLRLFDGERHDRRLHALRSLALAEMRRLAEFNPHLVGAVLNGSATEYSDVRLRLFTDSEKDVEMFLLNAGIDFVTGEGERTPGGAYEQLSYLVIVDDGSGKRRVGVVLSIHATDAIRVAPRARGTDPDLDPVEASGRASLAQVEAWLAGKREAAP